MITEAFFFIIFKIFSALFSLMPDVSWDVGSNGFTNFFEVIRVVCYFLPMDTVVLVLGLVFIIHRFRIIVALIKTIWQLLPFV